MQMMMSKCSTGFNIGLCLGLNLGPLGYAKCSVELGDSPATITTTAAIACARVFAGAVTVGHV